jgi:hypothetical protein
LRNRCAKPLEGASIHGEHEVIEITEHIIDRAQSAARVFGEVAGAQVFKPVSCDPRLRMLDQGIAQCRATNFDFSGHETSFVNLVQVYQPLMKTQGWDLSCIGQDEDEAGALTLMAV